MTDGDRTQTIERLKRETALHRATILEMITEAGNGHPGGSLSAIDLIATLFSERLRHDPARPDWTERDRFVLSKGHGVPALYVVLAKHGYFDERKLMTLRKLGSPLQGHPVVGTVPGIEACTGSLGQGLSIALGMALAAKTDGKSFKVYAMLGDGEIQEGQIWEAAMAAAKFKTDNLVAILDANRGQIDGHVPDVMPIEPIAHKWRAFGWSVREIDGHDFDEILSAYDWADAADERPKLIVARTVKGKGVSFMEDLVKWHGVAPTKDELAQALAELRQSAGAR